MLRLKQAFFTARMQNNIQGSQTELAVINAKISNWYKNESEKISLMSREADLNQSEKFVFVITTNTNNSVKDRRFSN